MIVRFKKTRPAFTLLELSLAIAFIAFLLLAIGMVTTQMAQIYQKGLTLRAVNITGRELVDEFTRTITAAAYTPPSGFNESTTIPSANYTQTWANIDLDGGTRHVPIHGAFCTGEYSYIWNTGYAISYSGTAPIFATLQGFSSDGDTPLRLVRVKDHGHTVCTSHEENSRLYQGGTEPTELLLSSENNLALYDLTVFKPIYHLGSGHAFFSGTFILGTIQGGVDITLSGDFCQDRLDNFKTDFTYCSVNKFNFAARATGESK